MGGGRSAWRRRTGEDPESSVGQALGTPKGPFKADLSALKPILAGAALEISKFGAPEPSCSESVLTSSRDSARVGRTAPFGARPEASGRRAPDGRTKKTLPSGQRKPAAGPLPCSQPQRRTRRLPASGTARASCAASTDFKKPSQPDPSLGSLPGSKLEAEPQARQSMRECANG